MIIPVVGKVCTVLDLTRSCITWYFITIQTLQDYEQCSSQSPKSNSLLQIGGACCCDPVVHLTDMSRFACYQPADASFAAKMQYVNASMYKISICTAQHARKLRCTKPGVGQPYTLIQVPALASRRCDKLASCRETL